MATATEQAKAVIELIAVIRETITAAGTSGIPSGHLYAMMMPIMGLDTYNRVITAFIDAGAITIRNHTIYAVVA